MSQRNRSQSHNPETNLPSTTTTTSKDISERSKKLDNILTKRPVSSNSSLLPEQLIRSRIIESKVVSVRKSGDNRKMMELKQIDDKLKMFMEKANQVSGSKRGGGGGGASLKINTTTKNTAKRILTSSQLNSPTSPNNLTIAPLSARVGGSNNPNDINPNDNTTTTTTTTTIIDYPLQNTWTLYYDRRGLNSRSQLHGINYETNLNTLCTFDSIRTFWSYFNQMKQPSELETNSNFHLFKSNIKPIWEDPLNEHGGKWTIHNCDSMLDAVWSRLVLSVVGERLSDDDDICGVVISKRPRGDKIAIWLKSTDFDRVFEIGKKILVECELVDTGGSGGGGKIQMEFNAHLDSMKRGSSYNVGSVGRKELTVEALRRSVLSERK